MSRIDITKKDAVSDYGGILRLYLYGVCG